MFALTPYQAMNGFRDITDIVANFKQLDIAELHSLVSQFETNQTEAGLEQFFTEMLSLDGEQKEQAVAALIAYSKQHQDDEFLPC